MRAYNIFFLVGGKEGGGVEVNKIGESMPKTSIPTAHIKFGREK